MTENEKAVRPTEEEIKKAIDDPYCGCWDGCRCGGQDKSLLILEGYKREKAAREEAEIEAAYLTEAWGLIWKKCHALATKIQQEPGSGSVKIVELKYELDELFRLMLDQQKCLNAPIGEMRISKAESALAKAREENERFRKALDSIMHEIGVPQPRYPQPVANAYEIAKEALKEPQ